MVEYIQTVVVRDRVVDGDDVDVDDIDGDGGEMGSWPVVVTLAPAFVRTFAPDTPRA